ncbi:MAG: DUF6798 domain-containing protein [Cyanobacteria bacterium P01_A01_bin.114]
MSFKSILRPLETYSFVLLSALAAYGYSFTRPNTYNQFPAIAALLNPDLFSQDFYIQAMTGFTPRFYYYHLMIFLNQLGLSLPLVAFGLFVIAFCSMVFGLRAIGKLLGHTAFSGLALAFLGIAITVGTLGHTSIFKLEPISAVYAMGLSVWGIYFCFCRRWRLGYLMFGAACLLQFLIGLLPGCLWGVILLIEAIRQRRLAKLLGPLLILGLFASLVYVPMVAAGNTSSTALSDAEFIHLYGYVRHPHHIIVSLFLFEEWQTFVSLIGASLICLRLSETLSPNHRRDLALVMVTTCALVIVNYIFVELLPIAFIAKLQFARATPFALLAALAAISVVASEYHRRGNYPVSLLMLALPLVDRVGPAILLVLTALLWWAKALGKAPRQAHLVEQTPLMKSLRQLDQIKLTAPRAVAIAYTLFLIVLLACWAYLPVFFASLAYPLLRRPYPKFFQRSRIVARAGIAGLLLYFGLNISGTLVNSRLTPLHRKVKLYPRVDDAFKTIAIQFRQMSPSDALILVPPSDGVFRYYSERSVVVTFKSFPFTDQGILTWKTRLERILGPLEAGTLSEVYTDVAYRQRSGQELTEIAREYQAGYILTRRQWHPDIEGTIVASVEGLVIWQLTPVEE